MTTTAPDLLTLATAGKGTVFSIQSGSTSFTGTVTTAGVDVTWVSGSVFTESLVGEEITINSVVYEVASITDDHNLVLVSTAGTQASAVAYTASAVAYTQVAELKTLNFSGSKNDLEDVTNFDSENRFKQYIATLADAGDCSISGNYISGDTGQSSFRGAFNSAAVLSYRIVLPLQAGQTEVGETWVFNGIVSELDNTIQYDKALSFTSKVKVTGPITVLQGS